MLTTESPEPLSEIRESVRRPRQKPARLIAKKERLVRPTRQLVEVAAEGQRTQPSFGFSPEARATAAQILARVWLPEDMRGFGFNLRALSRDEDVAIFYPGRTAALHREINAVIAAEILRRGGRIQQTVCNLVLDHPRLPPAELTRIADRGYFRIDPPGTLADADGCTLPDGYSPSRIPPGWPRFSNGH